MRICQFDHGQVPSGRVVAWLPSKSTLRALDATSIDPRPLTHDQLQHLRSAATPVRPQIEEGTPWLGFTCLLRNATPTSLATTFARYVNRHEGLRTTFALPEQSATQDEFERRTLPAGTVEFEPHELGSADTSIDTHAIVATHLAAWTRPNRWPCAAFVTVENVEGTTVFAAFDHLVFDGYSAYLGVAEVDELHRAVLAGEDEPASAGSYIDFATAERERNADASTREDCLAPWRDALDEHRRLPGLPSASGIPRGERHPHRFISLPIACPDETNTFVGHLRAAGTPIGLGFIALLVRAILLTEDAPRIRALMSTHNRAAEHVDAVGWFAGVVPLNLDLPEDADVATIAAATSAAFTDVQGAAQLPMPLVSQLLDADLEPSLVMSYMNSRRCPGSEHWERNRAKTLLGSVAPSDQMHAWISSLPDGTYLETRYPHTPQSEAWVHGLAASMRAELLDGSASFLPIAQGA